MLTYAQLTALPVQTRPRIIQVVDRGGAAYIIGANADGSTALPMMPNNDAARTTGGLGSTSTVTFARLNTANGTTGGLGVGQDMNWVRTGTREISLQNEDGNISGLAKLPAVQLTALSMNSNTLSITGNSTINQDVSTGGSPTFSGGTFTSGLNANSGLSVTGVIVSSSNIAAGTAASIGWSARSRVFSPADGQVRFTNNANTVEAQLLAGTQTLSGNGAANSPALRMTGAPYTGGTGTTTLPQLFLEPIGATARTTFTMNGTVIGSNQLNGFAGNHIDCGQANTSVFRVTSTGAIFASGSCNAGGYVSNGDIIIATSGNILRVPSTITPPGTNGAQTINRMKGSVNFAPGATSVVVTNSLCVVESYVDAKISTLDPTAIRGSVIPANGSFTIYMEEAPTNAIRVDFILFNPAP